MSNIQDKKSHTPVPENLVGRTLRKGEYFVKRVIGHGGMGTVYLATHTSLHMSFALKQARADAPLPESVTAELDSLLHTSATQRPTAPVKWHEYDFPASGGIHTDHFLREALFLARLQHAALPSLYDYFLEDGHWYLVMDYIPGPTLAAYLRHYAPLSPLEALNYAMQLCDVLDYLHKQTPPIIFRDLKPSNLILSSDGVLMLVDFGIARYFKEGQVNDTTDFGSPGYASPEQYQGEGQTDVYSDLFSLGVILHEMLSGQRPNALGGIRNTVQQLKPTVSSMLSGLVTLATRADPHCRFQSAHMFYLALDRAYLIEEQRAYQRQLVTVHEPSAVQAREPEPGTPRTALAVEQAEQKVDAEVILPASAKVLPLGQREQMREALQLARLERLEQERLETQLASVDESLKLRAAAPLSSVPQPFAEETEDAIPVQLLQQEPRRIPGIVRAAFIIALVIFVLMSSLLLYSRVIHHDDSMTKGQLVVVMPSQTVQTAVSSSWQVLPSLPSAQADNTVAFVQVHGRNYIYMTGGYRGPQLTPHYDRSLYRYDSETAHWEVVMKDTFPAMVNNAVAQDEQGHLFFTVGYSPTSNAVLSQLYVYQPGNGTLRTIHPPAPIAIGFGASMLADQQGHLYVTQGFMKSGDPHTQAGVGWYRYDIATGQWHQLAPLPQSFGYVVLAFDAMGNIVMLGGSRDAGQHQQSDSTYRYDIARNTWMLAQTRTPAPLSGVASCSPAAGQVVIIGGYDAVHSIGQSQVWLVDLATLQWTALASLPSGGSVLGAAACDGNGHVFLVRGASDPSRPTPDFWELTLHA